MNPEKPEVMWIRQELTISLEGNEINQGTALCTFAEWLLRMGVQSEIKVR